MNSEMFTWSLNWKQPSCVTYCENISSRTPCVTTGCTLPTHNDVNPSGLLGLFHNIHTLLDYTEEKKQTNKHLCNSKTTWVSQRKRRTILDFNDASDDHISDTLVSLHWLCVPGCIEYNIAVLVYKVQPGLAPHYLGPLTRVRSSRSSFRRHKPSSHSTCQVVHGRHPNLLGCRT